MTVRRCFRADSNKYVGSVKKVRPLAASSVVTSCYSASQRTRNHIPQLAFGAGCVQPLTLIRPPSPTLTGRRKRGELS
jgi:hypothetical protein